MGELAEYLTMAFENIRHNKGRSFLTMLGIIIGIASVITITMVGNAFSRTVSDTLENIGGGQIFLYVGDDGAAADAWITPEDMSALGASDGVEGVTPFYSVGGSTETGKGNFSLTISGGTPILGKIQYSNMEIVKGRNISETDIENGSRICVMKRTDVQKMFGTDDVIGMSIPVTSGDVTLTYKIIGLLDTAKGEEDSLLSLMNSEEDVGLIVPFPSLADWGYDTESFTGAYVLCDGSVESGKVAEAALKLLNRRHQVPQKDNYFLVQNFTDTFDQMNSLMGTVTIFVMLVAAISLVVGGIGVMNIMLVSVTERTNPEIDRRDNCFHYDAVPGGVRDYRCHGRRDRYSCRIDSVSHHLRGDSYEAGHFSPGYAFGRRGINGDRYVFRHLSGQKSSAP